MVRRPKPVPDPERDGAFLSNGRAAKAGMNRSIHQHGWSLWLGRVEQKAQASGIAVITVPAPHTSDGCRKCGHQARENRESQAIFRCRQCGHTGHADREAAHNILARALQLAPTAGQAASQLSRPAARGSRSQDRSGNSPRAPAHAA
jgi:putative transposase